MNHQLLAAIANTIRGLSMDAVQKAKSGHPGMPMGMADVGAVLWSEFLRYNPANPRWYNRDRFVLSGGHGSMLLYSLLHIFGYDLSLDDIRQFRQWDSKTPGHPEYGHTPGVETTTGPLGQGLANAVGMALAEVSLAARYNRRGYVLTDHYTYVMAGDGDLEEGISHEAASLAGHWKLGKLILLYDDNGITIDGGTGLSFTEDVLKRFQAYGWHTLRANGHDYDEIRSALQQARANTHQPTLIAFKTVIGYGSPHKAGTHGVHGAPLGEEEIRLTKERLGLPQKDFYVPAEVKTLREEYRAKGRQLENDWQQVLDAFAQKYPAKARRFTRLLAGDFVPRRLTMPAFPAGKDLATRAASGKILDAVASKIPALLGGSADLTPSNKTFPKGETSFSHQNPRGRYIHYGVREHGMAAIMNGLYLHGGVLPYGGTFFVFADYMRPAMRMAALMRLPVIYVLTHDSIGLGEDGPTHQPVAQLASLRAMPDMWCLRPMDGAETAVAWELALRRTDGPTALVLTRQKLAERDRKALGWAPARKARFGAYVLTQDKNYDLIILASGSEVHLAVEVKKRLNQTGRRVRVVNFFSQRLFDAQPASYRQRVLPKSKTKRVAIEAASGFGWDKYTGLKGRKFTLDHFGASAPYKELYAHYGLTADAIAEQLKDY